MNWFERITGFAERDYEITQSLLRVEGEHLVCARTQRRWGTGRFEAPSLAELRERAGTTAHVVGRRTRFRAIAGDARDLHCDPANAQALFQVASQFNALEMVGPSVTPEEGVSRYANDPTQGPACAIAAGAATIWRNYLVPLSGEVGQRADRQIDTMRDLGNELGNERGELWQMQNGYALCSGAGLHCIDSQLGGLGVDKHDLLKGFLRTALHWDVEVTASRTPQTVSQAFCSALPCRYSQVPLEHWERFARFVLEAAYEATLLAGVLNLRRTGCPVIYLTRLGGGAFGNPDAWIIAAVAGALERHAASGLDVRLVCLNRIPMQYHALEAANAGMSHAPW